MTYLVECFCFIPRLRLFFVDQNELGKPELPIRYYCAASAPWRKTLSMWSMVVLNPRRAPNATYASRYHQRSGPFELLFSATLSSACEGTKIRWLVTHEKTDIFSGSDIRSTLSGKVFGEIPKIPYF